MQKKIISLVILFGGMIQLTHAQVTPITPKIEQLPPIVDRLPGSVDEKLRQVQNRNLPEAENTIKDLPKLLPSLTRLPEPILLLSNKQQLIHREVLTQQGNLAVEREWVFLGKQSDLSYFSDPSFTVVETKELAALNKWMIRLRVIAALDDLASLHQKLPESLRNQIDRHHIYLSQRQGFELNYNNQKEHVARCTSPVRFGMIDTAVALQHEAFNRFKIEQRDFIPAEISSSYVHGTAVAGLAASSLSYGSEMVNANVFYTRNPVSDGATLPALIEGLNYLVSKNVDVINMSLAGPDNLVLKQVISEIDKLNVQIVAAAGNQGPSSKPLYPAAYENVLAVTAVDKNMQIYRWANQGEYIDFAAFGVSVNTIHPSEKQLRQTGTSMAAPKIASKYACQLKQNNRSEALMFLKAIALDIGEPGKDPVYGHGIIQN